jgi:hypothetical protein
MARTRYHPRVLEIPELIISNSSVALLDIINKAADELE